MSSRGKPLPKQGVPFTKWCLDSQKYVTRGEMLSVLNIIERERHNQTLVGRLKSLFRRERVAKTDTARGAGARLAQDRGEGVDRG